MKRIFMTLILSLAVIFHVKAAGWEPASKAELLNGYQKAIDWFTKNERYSVAVTYASFVDHSSTIAFDKSGGSYMREGKKVMSDLLGVRIVANGTYSFSVDTASRLIILNNLPEEKNKPAGLEEFSTLLDRVKAIKKQKTDAGIIYRIELKENALYERIEIEISTNGLLQKQTFFYSKEIKEENDDTDELGNPQTNQGISGKPRIEISFSNYQTQLQPLQQKEFSEKKYFNAEGKKIILTSAYKNYTLKDYRFDIKK